VTGYAPEPAWLVFGLPAALTVWFVGGMLAYAVYSTFHGAFWDPELEKRGSFFLLGRWLRGYFAWLTRPILRALIFLEVAPSAVTGLSVLFPLFSGVAVATGNFFLGGWLYYLGGISDFLDGRLARARNAQTKGGVVLDSVLDRYSDAALLVGLGWFYRESWVLFVVLLALVGSSLVPYIRARGEALGIRLSEVGWMLRGQRVVVLGTCVTLAPFLDPGVLTPTVAMPPYALAVAALVFVAVLTQVTALHRFLYVLRALAPRSFVRRRRRNRAVRAVSFISLVFVTLVDFLLMISFVVRMGMSVPLATVLAGLLGSVLYAVMTDLRGSLTAKRVERVRTKYMLHSFVTALLNGLGVAVVLLFSGLDYRLAWLTARAGVFGVWNILLDHDRDPVLRGQPLARTHRVGYNARL